MFYNFFINNEIGYTYNTIGISLGKKVIKC